MAAGPDDVAAGLGDARARRAAASASAARSGAQKRPMSCTGCAYSIGKPAADVERVVGAELLAARRRHELRAGPDRLRVLARHRRSASRRGRTGRARAMPRSAARRASGSRSSGSQPNLRDRSTTAPGTRNETRSSSSARSARRANLRTSSGLSATNSAHAEGERVGDVRGALDRVRVDAALGRHPEALHQLHLPGRGQIQAAALRHDRLHHRRMRQRLECVVQRRRRAAPRRACGTARARARSRGSAAVSRTRAPGGGCARAANGSMQSRAAAPARI